MKMENSLLRNASIQDIPFLVDTIIEAEKSGTNTLTYCTIFGLTEEEARKYIAEMLLEEVDGCELSISSFLLAEINGEIAASVCAWVEGVDSIPSTVLKGNLLNFTLPAKSIERAVALNHLVRELHIEYIPNTIQIGLVYVSLKYRGQNLVSVLIDEQVSRLTKKKPNVTYIYVQVFGNNLPAIRAYEKAGFKTTHVKQSSDMQILSYMPSNKKILMKRVLTND
jgi:hypothetical protein